MDNFQKMTVFFFTGVLSVQLLPTLPSIWFLLFGGALALCVYKWTDWFSFILFGFILSAGYSLFVQSHYLPASVESQEILIVGQVTDLPVRESGSIKFLFNVDKVVLPEHDLAFPKKIQLRWYGQNKNVHSGEKWQLLVKLKRPHGLFNPHGFDYEKWLFHQGIGATGYVRQADLNIRIAEADVRHIGAWREALQRYLDHSLEGYAHLGVIKALVLGDRSDISANEWGVFRKTGTSHLIAISGLHIGLVSALMFGLIRWLVLRVPLISRFANRYAIAAAITSATFYAALAGFSLPTQRALIMLSVVLFGVLWQRHYKPFHIISVALLAVLVYDPLAPMSPGFWLSFGAVLVILYGVVGRVKKTGFARQLVRVQWWVSIGLMPLTVFFFQQVSLVGPLANLVAVPFVSFVVVPLLILALLLSAIDYSLGALLLNVCAFLFDLLWLLLNELASLEFSTLLWSPISLLACVLAVMGVAFMLMPKSVLPKPLVCFLFLPLFFPIQADELEQEEFKLVLLDVGQGLSAIIHTAEHTVVFDTGAKYSEKSNVASTVIVPYLLGEGVKKVDQLVISHGDNDHAGGAQTVLSSLPVKQLLTSVPEMFPKDSPVLCEVGMGWTLDGVSFEFLSPAADHLFDGNNASCVLKVSSSNGRVLLTGDIEKHVESSLVRSQSEKLKNDVLIAPHHGSTSSSTIDFIKAADPEFVLFSAGYKNRFGFPKETVVKRYKTLGIKTFNTAEQGAITAHFVNNKPIELKSFREEAFKFWNWTIKASFDQE